MPKNDPFLDPPKNPLFWGFWGVPRKYPKKPEKTLKKTPQNPKKDEDFLGFWRVF